LSSLPPAGSPERYKAIKDWFHGTLGNFMLTVLSMGQRVQDALLITEMRTDGIIKKDDDGNYLVNPEFKVTRDRIKVLSEARTQDSKAGEWDADTASGPRFNAKIDEFIKEDANGGPARQTDARMSLKDLEARGQAGIFKSKAVRSAFKVAAGVKDADLPKLDELAARGESVFALIDKHLDNLTDPRMQEILARVRQADPVDFESFLLENSHPAPSGLQNPEPVPAETNSQPE
jgi:hypothetical protein